MKYIIIIAILLMYLLPNYMKAQTDTTKSSGTDTVVIMNGKGKVIFKIKNGERKATSLYFDNKNKKKRYKVETHWFGFDWGFNNYVDQTEYNSISGGPIAPNNKDQFFIHGIQKGDLELIPGKSMHFNFAIFKQGVSIYKHYVNLVYGLTYDINNYRYKRSITWMDGEYSIPGMPFFLVDGPYLRKETTSFRKSKLVTNYLQAPVMLRIETNPTQHKKNVCISGGGYAGYLVRSHTKQIRSGSNDKDKNFDSFNLTKVQYGLLAELSFRERTIYFKRSLTPLTEYGTEQYTYCFGIRIAGF